jgi:hypothetical protein
MHLSCKCADIKEFLFVLNKVIWVVDWVSLLLSKAKGVAEASSPVPSASFYLPHSDTGDTRKRKNNSW